MEATMKYPLIVLCSALLASAAVANENDPSRTTDATDLFKTVDANADGKVSKEEASANASFATSFASLDGNSDGVVTKREFRRNTMPKPRRD
jgi:Ca2+-binding EF-hand superfamily protein